MIDIGDRPGHAFSISQFKCTWTKPLEYSGIKNKEGTGTEFDEISGQLEGLFVGHDGEWRHGSLQL